MKQFILSAGFVFAIGASLNLQTSSFAQIQSANIMAQSAIPMLAEQVASGDLPPMQERLPKTPFVVDFAEEEKTIGRYGGSMNLLMGKAKDIGQITVYTYARLVGYDQNFELQPDLVQSVDVVEGRQFTFTLREGHKWSDGHPFTSEDFRYYWEDMVKNPDIGRSGAPLELTAKGKEPIFEVINERQFRYTWDDANPVFLAALAKPSPLFIYRPAHYMKQFHAKYRDKAELDAIVKDLGSRDWVAVHTRKQRQRRPENPDLPTLQSWRNTTPPPSTRFVFERNPYFHRVDSDGKQLPYIDRLYVNIVSKDVIPPKAGTGESDLQARYLRFDNVPFLKQGEEKGNYNLNLWRVGRGSKIALFPNLNVTDPDWRKLVRDARFRRALSLGIDRSEINQAIYFGLATASANTILPQSNLYRAEYAQAWTDHDPKLANALLDEMGLTQRNSKGTRLMENGKPLEITVETAGESTEETDVLELIGNHYQQIGIKLFVRASQRDIFRRRAYAGETVLSVFNGLNNALPSADMDPKELAPHAQAQLEWPQFGQFAQTAGSAGTEIDMPDVARQVALHREWLSATSGDVREKVWHEMLKNYTNQVYSIGTVNGSRQPVVVSKDLKNVPSEGIYAWDPTSFFGVYRPDTFWFDQ